MIYRMLVLFKGRKMKRNFFQKVKWYCLWYFIRIKLSMGTMINEDYWLEVFK